jgi:cysteine synthase A
MENTEMKIRLERLKGCVGNTPMLKIDFEYKRRPMTIYAKAEYFNYTGSIKDRMAYHILSEAYRTGELRPGMKIYEATSGNPGIAFSALGRAMGHDVTIFMPNWMSAERINLIRGFGANIRLVTPEEGGFLGSIAMTKEAKEKDPDNIFLPCQFDNHNNCEAHYNTTGPEIVKQLATLGLVPDGLVAGVGTGGTVMGAGRYLKEVNPNVKNYPLEPANSPTMSTGYRVGKHRIQGISDEFIPSIVKLDRLDDIIMVDDGDSIIMAQMLAKNFGLGVGISSGANFLGAIMALEKLGDDKVVVTIFSDDSKKYLSTDYAREEPVKDDFMSTHVELKDITVIGMPGK